MSSVPYMPPILSVVLDGTGSGLVLLDPNTATPLARPAEGVCRGAAWSPDAQRLAFCCNDDLLVTTVRDGATNTLLGGISRRTRRPLTFSQGTDFLAAALEHGVMVLPMIQQSADGSRIPIPKDMYVEAMFWSMRDVLSIQCQPSQDPGRPPVPPQVIEWQVRTGQVNVRPANFELLGSRGSDCLVVGHPVDDEPNRRAAMLLPSGESETLLELPEGQFVYRYLGASDTFVIGSCGEDPGSDVDLQMAAAAGGSPEPCIGGIGGVREVAFSDDGQWATMIRDATETDAQGMGTLGLMHVPSRSWLWLPSSLEGILEGARPCEVVPAPTSKGAAV